MKVTNSEIIDKLFDKHKEKINQLAFLSSVTGFPIKCYFDESKCRFVFELVNPYNKNK